MKTITSVQNEEIKKVAALAQTKERQLQQRCIVEGKRAIQTFIAAGKSPVAFYTTQEMLSQAQNLLSSSSPITLVSDAVMQKMSPSSTPSGLLAVFEIPKTNVSASLQIEPGIVLAQIADPGNMGTLIRTCAALGKKTVVIIEGADAWSPKVIQSSAGTIALVQIIHMSWEELVAHKKNLHLCALVVSGGTQPQKLDLTHSLLIIGSEAHGMPNAWITQCEQRLTLPMPGSTESLNAAVAGSIAMYLAWMK